MRSMVEEGGLSCKGRIDTAGVPKRREPPTAGNGMPGVELRRNRVHETVVGDSQYRPLAYGRSERENATTDVR